MTLVIALGGNALLRRGEPLDAERQRANVMRAAESLAPVLAEHRAVLTHGNGPQVGLLALQAHTYAVAHPQTPAFPLDVLGAQTEGMIGYMLERELMSRMPQRAFATLLTQIAVDAHDQAFARPSKPIGPQYAQEEAERLAAARGWSIACDGEGWRRVVASPAPRRILELPAIRALMRAEIVVICAGGGGIPVVENADGGLSGIEAVIDKDAASALLALQLDAERLIMLTDVPAVTTEFGTPRQRAVRIATPEALSTYAFAAGSMAPKIDAAIAMANAGKRAAIGAIGDIEAILAGHAGTWIVPAVEAREGICWHP
jgi:carbamate kinase